jgi:kynureninase
MVGDSTSVNLFKVLSASLEMRPERRVIASERGNFPTDLYIAEGLTALLDCGHELRLAEREGVAAALDADVAALMLTHVDYRSGRMHDMAAVTAAAHAVGAVAIWDLAHSAGVVPLDVAGADADFAVGCGYKYLNGGPGAPAFLYAAPRLHERMKMPLTGWFSHAAPFAFEPRYRPASGIARAAVGTPPILSLAALEVGVDLLLEAPTAALRAKSLKLTDLFAALVRQECAEAGFGLVTPTDPASRGSQVSLMHADGYPIMQALIARGVIGDFRAPDILRLGFAPLYLRFADVWDAVATLVDVMRSATWREPRFSIRAAVT